MTEMANGPGADPVTFGDGLGVVCVPIPGLFSNVPELRIADLTVRMIDVLSWRQMENNRATDIYTYHYQQLPRYFLVRPVYDEDDALAQAEVAAALQDTWDLVLALRLLSEDDLIGPEHVVPYQRVGMVNVRPVPDVWRSRFMVTTLGEGWTFRNRDLFTEREWDEDLQSLGGNPFGLAGEDAPIAAERLKVVRAWRETAPAPLLEAAVRNFSVGRSRLTKVHQRLIALFCAMETLTGGFRKPGTRPSLGDLTGTLMFPEPGGNPGWAEEFEGFLRPVRNALAHGDDRHDAGTLETAWRALSQVVRIGLTTAMKIAAWDPAHWEQLAGLPGNPRGGLAREDLLLGLHMLIMQTYRGNPKAVALLAELRN